MSKRGSLSHFERHLERAGAADAPNGYHYKLTFDPQGRPVVERTLEGERETIVGWNSDRFESRDRARGWALSDARSIPGPGLTLPEREHVAKHDETVCAISLSGEGERVAVVERYGDKGSSYLAVHVDEHGTFLDYYPRRSKIGEAMADAGELFESTTGGRY